MTKSSFQLTAAFVRTLRVAVGVIAFMHAVVASALPPPERVRFESADRANDRPVMVDALLYRPSGADAQRPAVIALHGCGGLYRSDPAHRDALTARHASHVEAWLEAGYLVVLPDSFRSRGVDEVCTVKAIDRKVTLRSRKLDTLGALRWLAEQPGIARDRIALVGWSMGGSTALAAINGGDNDVAAFVANRDRLPFFRAMVAFYPGCASSLRNDRWRPLVTTRVLIGAADDWTPAEPCVSLGAKAREREWPLETKVYVGAYHGFDAPSGRFVHRTDVPGGLTPGRGVHVGPDPAAREDANRRVLAFLRERLSP